MRLGDWLDQQGITASAFALMIGVQPSAVSKMRLGRSRPSWPTLDRIAEVTGGAVTPNDFHQIQNPAPSQEIAA